LKFIGNELGSQTTYKEKGNDVQSLIKGSFTENLPALLDKFLFFIICFFFYKKNQNLDSLKNM